mmetsp:Transcript_97132/g.302390  ORF Transcript_97132/g.302390 Transcript_97132/m.302390 type:complete len:519 (-) Transcript_97132:15-1571(-)
MCIGRQWWRLLRHAAMAPARPGAEVRAAQRERPSTARCRNVAEGAACATGVMPGAGTVAASPAAATSASATAAEARLLHREAELVPLHVHGLHTHLHLLADGELVLDALDEAIADARDVHEPLGLCPVLRGRLDKGAEGRDVDNCGIQPLVVRDVNEGRDVLRRPSAAAAAADLALNHGEAKLAVVPDLRDPALHLLALLHVLVDVVHALVGDAGDVHETVARGADVNERAKVPDAPHGARVLGADLQILDGDRRGSHALGADGRVLRAAIRVLPLDLESAVFVHLDDRAGVHLPVVREDGLHLVVHLVGLEDRDLLHLLGLQVVGLRPAVRVVPLHLEGAVSVGGLDGARVPTSVIRGGRLDIVAHDVVLEDENLLDVRGLDVLGLRPSVGVVPPHGVRAVVLDGVDGAGVLLLVVGRDRLHLVAHRQVVVRPAPPAGPRGAAPAARGDRMPGSRWRGGAREPGNKIQRHGREAGGERDGSAQQGQAGPGGPHPWALGANRERLSRHGRPGCLGPAL